MPHDDNNRGERIGALSHVTSAWPSQRGGELEVECSYMANDSISHTYKLKSREKLETTKLRRASLVNNILYVLLHIGPLGGWCVLTVQGGSQKLCISNPPRPCPIYFFFWLPVCVLPAIMKLITCIVLSWVLWVIPVNDQTWRGGVILEFVVS